jgi:hypothetical protein
MRNATQNTGWNTSRKRYTFDFSDVSGNATTLYYIIYTDGSNYITIKLVLIFSISRVCN